MLFIYLFFHSLSIHVMVLRRCNCSKSMSETKAENQFWTGPHLKISSFVRVMSKQEWERIMRLKGEEDNDGKGKTNGNPRLNETSMRMTVMEWIIVLSCSLAHTEHFINPRTTCNSSHTLYYGAALFTILSPIYSDIIYSWECGLWPWWLCSVYVYPIG